MTAGTGPSPRPKHRASATAATAKVMPPARRRLARLAAPEAASAGAGPAAGFPPPAGASAPIGKASSSEALPSFAAPVPKATAPRTSFARCHAFAATILQITPTPAPIMTPMPRLETMPWPFATSQRPAEEPPTTMPKFASSAPANHTATAPVPTRKPTASSMGEL